jgi:amidophosphoribosyltransferase
MQIREYIRADSLAYLSLAGLRKACGDGEKTTYCSACYSGKYPTSIVDVEEILPAEVAVGLQTSDG